ncbi:bifunctional 5,10-methylenetetrahydrofolate dehydrogenase/5,10-methenyltetrahydrofolate cyclohydrolase [Glutamicibacter sp. X7]
MTARVLGGKPVAARIREEVAQKVEQLQQSNVKPKLAIVVATDNGATQWYVRSIEQSAHRAGIACDVHDLGSQATVQIIAETLNRLSADREVHGIILQTPLPEGASLEILASHIAVEKDIDGVNPMSFGCLSAGLPAYAPATARAVIEILDHYEVPIAGQDVAVVGRSMVIGRPVMQLLLNRHATVTACHSRTVDLAAHTRRADIVVAAAGSRDLITAEHLNPQAVVIDVGTNVDEQGNLVGDVDYAAATEAAQAVTPVPGGVGTVTTSLLLLHVVESALRLGRPCAERWVSDAPLVAEPWSGSW